MLSRIVVFTLMIVLSLVNPFSLALCQQVSGKILSATDGRPVVGASVFLANTSFGSVSDEHGQFQITRVPVGKYELVVSFVGYSTQVSTIQVSGDLKPMEIALKEKADELANVVVEPFEKQNWERWGRFFLENFIGTMPEASQCKIRNTKKIFFRFYKRSNRLVAFCDEPLVIENKALGYTIHYQLELFEYQFSSRRLFYQGYPLFEEMESGSSRKMRQWEDNRAESYFGSMTHFMRSFYRNQLVENKFEVHHMVKLENEEKKRVKLIMRANPGRTYDSSAYYNRILEQPDFKDVVDAAVLPGDSIGFGIDDATAGLFFPDYLYIVYKKPEPLEYAQQQKRPNMKVRVSYLQLTDETVISVGSNGNYYPPTAMIHSGYWSWSEKMATTLPLNYTPSTHSRRLDK